MIKMSYNFNTQITFENGLTISIAIGEGNYCSNRKIENSDINPYNTYVKQRESKNCEAIVFDVNHNDLDIQQFLPEGINGDGSKIAGWIKADDLAEIIYKVKNWKE